MINIIISLVLIVLIIILIQYQKEKFEVTDYNNDIIMLQQMLKRLKDLKKKTPLTLINREGEEYVLSTMIENADGSDTEHSIIDSLIYKRALEDSVKIEKKLNELFRKLS